MKKSGQQDGGKPVIEKFTPSPWDIHGPNDNGIYEIHPFHDQHGVIPIADIVCENGMKKSTQKANAALIKSSPKLYGKLADIRLALLNGGLKKPKQWVESITSILDEAKDTSAL